MRKIREEFRLSYRYAERKKDLVYSSGVQNRLFGYVP